MSRTVCIRTVRKVRKAEISKFEKMTRKEIVCDYENVMSLYEGEYVSDTYSPLQKHMTRIETVDGHVLYIAHTKILAMCTDGLLASEIEGKIRNYVADTYRDITKLAGQLFTATETKTIRTGDEHLLKTIKRTMKFKLPDKERGVYIYFYDDMD